MPRLVKQQSQFFIEHMSKIKTNSAIAFTNQQFKKFKGITSTRKKDSYSILGSTFRTNDQRRLEREAKTSHILDAVYSGFSVDEENNVTGAVLAVGDGCGGHFGDTKQDRAIANVARLATEKLSQAFARYEDPNLLAADILKVLQVTTKGVDQEKGQFCFEQTTLGGVKLFYQPDGKMHVVGVNIGDSLLIAYNPYTKAFTTLSPALQSAGVMSGTAMFPPVPRNQEEVRPINTCLEAGTIVMGLTDFVTEHLPTKEVNITINGGQYQQTELDSVYMQQLLRALPEDVSVGQVIKTIVQDVIAKAEAQRKAKLSRQEKTFRMGDDVGITAIRLPLHSMFASVKQLVKHSECVDEAAMINMVNKTSVAEFTHLLQMLARFKKDNEYLYSNEQISAAQSRFYRSYFKNKKKQELTLRTVQPDEFKETKQQLNFKKGNVKHNAAQTSGPSTSSSSSLNVSSRQCAFFNTKGELRKITYAEKPSTRSTLHSRTTKIMTQSQAKRHDVLRNATKMLSTRKKQGDEQVLKKQFQSQYNQTLKQSNAVVKRGRLVSLNQ